MQKNEMKYSIIIGCMHYNERRCRSYRLKNANIVCARIFGGLFSEKRPSIINASELQTGYDAGYTEAMRIEGRIDSI